MTLITQQIEIKDFTHLEICNPFSIITFFRTNQKNHVVDLGFTQ